MNDRETRRYEMFGRVITFGKDRAAEFPPGSAAAGHFTKLEEVVADLDAAKATQGSGGGTAKEVLLDALRMDVHNIVRTARALALEEPGMADRFRLPDSPSQTALFTTVDAVLGQLQAAPGDSPETTAAKQALVARFVGYMLPPDFVTDLAADRATALAAQDAQESTASASVASTASISVLMREGLKFVTHLDAIVHNRFGRQPDVIRAWQSASHTERAPQREKKPAGAGAGAPAGAAA